MKNGQCPKCNSTSVHVTDTTLMSIPLSAFSVARVGLYVCAQCGYVELYVKDEELLPKIAATYMSVNELKEVGS